MKGDFAEPKNQRGTFISYSSEMGSDFTNQDDWMNENDYSVRLEVMRSLKANPKADPDGPDEYEYTLHTWIKRCPVTCMARSRCVFIRNRIREKLVSNPPDLGSKYLRRQC